MKERNPFNCLLINLREEPVFEGEFLQDFRTHLTSDLCRGISYKITI